MEFILPYFIMFTSVNKISIVTGYVVNRLLFYLQTNMGYTLNKDIISIIQHAPLNCTSELDSAYLNQRVNNDASSIVTFCLSVIQNSLNSGFVFISVLAILFTIHSLLAGLLLCVAFAYFMFYMLYKDKLYKVSFLLQESQSKFFSRLNEQLTSVRFIKLHSLYLYFINRLNRTYETLLKNTMSYQSTNYVFGGLDRIVMVISQTLLLLIGGREIIEGRLTVGLFIVITSYNTIMLGSIRYFFGLGQATQNTMVALKRIEELVALKRDLNGEIRVSAIRNITLKKMSFSYANKMIFSDFNLELSCGQTYVIMGSNGTGKSTLIDIIVGLQNEFYDGEVYYNGILINELDMCFLRNNRMGISEQEPVLMSDTIVNNLYLDKREENADCESIVKQLLYILGLDAFVNALPSQFNTVVSEGATNISGGEKQKLSIMRVLLKDPDLIILDEPTSALDTASKLALKTYLTEINKDKIILVITHDEEFVDYTTDVIIRIG